MDEYYIKRYIGFEKEPSLFMALPTVVYVPRKQRYPNTFIIDICWLFWHIGIGLWKRKDK